MLHADILVNASVDAFHTPPAPSREGRKQTSYQNKYSVKLL